MNIFWTVSNDKWIGYKLPRSWCSCTWTSFGIGPNVASLLQIRTNDQKRKSPIKKCIALKKFILTITYFWRTKMNNINIINPGLKRTKFKGNFSIISFRPQTGRSLLKLSKSRKKLSIAVVTACQQSTLTQVETKNYESLQQPASWW